MTDLNDELVTADAELTRRVQDAVQPGHFGASLRNAAGVLGIQIKWYEADVLAEALGRHYERAVEVYRVVHPSVPLDEARQLEGRTLLCELLAAAHDAGLSLIETPVETVHLAYDVVAALAGGSDSRTLRKSPPMSDYRATQLASGHLDQYPVIVLTGRCRRLAEPRPETPRGTHAH